MMTTQGVTNCKTLYSLKLKSLTSPRISHVCNRRHVSYALLEILCVLQIRVHARSFDRCTCLLYYATKFLEMQAEIISFLLIGLISLMRVD